MKNKRIEGSQIVFGSLLSLLQQQPPGQFVNVHASIDSGCGDPYEVRWSSIARRISLVGPRTKRTPTDTDGLPLPASLTSDGAGSGNL